MQGHRVEEAPQLSYRGLQPSNSHSLLPHIQQSRNASQPQFLSSRQASIPNMKSLLPTQMSRKDMHHINILKKEFKKK